MITAPIWKDTQYTTLSSVSPITYRIEDQDGETIFNGRAWAKPDADSISININKICQNHLSSNIHYSGRTITTGTYYNSEALGTFYLYDGNDNLLETYRFLLDWSYEDKNFSADFLMSAPINGHYATGMFLFGTYWDYSDKEPITTVSTNPSAVTFNYQRLYNDLECGRYALYYLNRNGGWDSFLIEGKTNKRDNYEKYYTDNSFNNNTLDYERKTYHTNITTSYELNTGWLSDEESQRLAFHLFSSPLVYIHDLCTGEIQPANIKDESVTYKTFKGEGQLVSYLIEVEESQTKRLIA